MSGRRFSAPVLPTLLGLAALTALAIGVVAGTYLARPRVPPVLASAQITTATVSFRDLDDSRLVNVMVSVGAELPLMSPTEGRLTSVRCEPGTTVASGTSSFAVDGEDLLALSTGIPPWRDLDVGDRGPDVAALHDELRRLGQAVPSSDLVTTATVLAFREVALAAGAGSTSSDERIALANFFWLPATEVTVATCPAVLGALVTTVDPLITLLTDATATVSALPQDALAGGRVIVVDEATEIPVTDDGQIADAEAISVLVESDAYAAAVPDESGNRTLSLHWRLAETLSVGVVPPSAVHTPEPGGDSCVVTHDGLVIPVTIVGSELGQTFVTATDPAKPITTRTVVDLDTNLTCD